MASPNSIMQRLEALKLWQEAEQEKLLLQQINQRNTLLSEQRRVYEALGLSFGSDTSSTQIYNVDLNLHNASGDCDVTEVPNGSDIVIEGVSKMNDSISSYDSSTSEKEIIPNLCNEQELTEFISEDHITFPAKPVIKRPYLKRGSGLIKYRMNLDDCKLSNLPKYKFLKVKPKPKTDKINAARKSLFSSEAGKQKKIVMDVKRPKSSLIKNDTGSRESKTYSQDTRISEPDTVVRQSNNLYDIIISNPKQSWGAVLNKGNMHNKLNDSLINAYENPHQDTMELKMFELLEQNANNSSFCSTSSIVTKFLGTNPLVGSKTLMTINPNSKQVLMPDENKQDSTVDNTRTSFCDPNPQKLRVRFDDNIQVQTESDTTETDVYSYEDLSSLTSSCTSTPNVKLIQYSDGDISQDSTLQSEMENRIISTTIHVKQPDKMQHKVSDNNVKKIETQNPGRQIIEQSSLLKERLQELEQEINLFRQQNAALTRHKEQFEMKKQAFEMEKSKIEERLREEKFEFDDYVANEKQKLIEEKTMFEKFVSDLKKNPNRKEREEITTLKDKIIGLQTEIRSKDANSGATQARLRTQIKKLETEIAKHVKSIDELKEKNKKLLLANNQYRRSANKKMLQEIQSNLPQLLDESLTPPPILKPDFVENDVLQDVTNTRPHNEKRGYFSESSGEDDSPKTLQKPLITMVDKETMTDNEVKSPVNKSTTTDNFDYSSFKKMQENAKVKILEQEKARNAFFQDNLSENCCEDFDDILRRNKFLVDKRIAELNSVNAYKFSRSRYDHQNYYCSDNTTKRAREQYIASSVGSPSSSDRQEVFHPDGKKEIWYANGNVKKVSADGLISKMIYFNGDSKEVCLTTGNVKYFYANNNIWHTTCPDGMEILEFPK